MRLTVALQPDQNPKRWSDHVAVYEEVFEPLTNVFATCALDQLALRPIDRLIEIGAGAGGAALLAAAECGEVVAVDASSRMAARIASRAGTSGKMVGRISACTMDGMALGLREASFDAAISVFGVVLFPDADLGMCEMTRVLKPGGRAAIVTWTETERYELVARLLAAIVAVRGPQPALATLPAQLRFRETAALRRLLADAGLIIDTIVRVEERWRLPSARWIADHIAFAPGMAAMIDALGPDRTHVLETFVAGLERDQGEGTVMLSAVAHIGIAHKPTAVTTPIGRVHLGATTS